MLFRFLVSVCLLAALPATAIAAGSATYRLGIDVDARTHTGCAFDPGTGHLQDGVELVLEVEIDTNFTPVLVTRSEVSSCPNGTFLPPTSLGSGWAVGINNGRDGSDVIEAALPSQLIGNTRELALIGGAMAASGTDDTARSVVRFPHVIPTLGTWALALLILCAAGMGLVLIKRNGRFTLVAISGLALMGLGNIMIIVDGNVGDWGDVPPVALDPKNDAGSSPSTDIRAIFLSRFDDTLAVRFDITDVENDAPVAVDDVATTDEGVSVVIDVLANDSDPDGDVLAVASFSQGSNGTVTDNGDGTLTYAPTDADFKGSDSFTYVVGDAGGLSDSATVDITISPLNDPPVAVDDAYTVDEDSGTTAFTVLDNDSDPDTGDSLSVTLVTVPDNGGVAVISGGGTSVDYTPALDFFGTETFQYTVSDLIGETDVATVIVTVTPVNDDPVANDDAFTVDEDTSANIFDVLANDSDVDIGDSLSIASIDAPDNGGTAVIIGDTIEYSPAANFFGLETFGYEIQDSAGAMAMAIISVTVNPVNDDPEANDDSFTVDEDSTANTLDVLSNDTDVDLGDSLSVTMLGAPDQGGTAVISAGGTAVDYTPAPDFFGDETFQYTVSDSNSAMDTATVTVTVSPVNDLVTANDDAFSAPEDNVTTSINVLSNDTAPDGGLAVDSADATSGAGAPVTGNGDGTFDYDPTGVAAFQALDDGETAADTFSYVARDVDGDTDSAVVNVTVDGANDAPVADDTVATVDQNESIVITLSGSDVDIENLSFAIQSGPSNGSLGAVTPLSATTANVTYTHDNSLNFTDSFTYTANDGTVNSAPATVTLTIVPNVPPVAVDDGSMAAPLLVQENMFVDIDVAANDMDSDGSLDLSSIVSANGTAGTTAPQGGGIVRYTPNMDATGADTFTYTIADNDAGISNSATVYLNINAAPVADDDSSMLSEGSMISIDVLGNDSDADGTLDPTSVNITTDVGAGEGSTTVNLDGTVTYDAQAFTGNTSFQYTVTDNQGGVSNIAAVSIFVSPNPMAGDDAFNVFGHTTVAVPAAIGLLGNDSDDGTFSAVAGTFATDNGGSITVNADGSFSYTTPGPAAAIPPSLGGTDTYTYTIIDNLMGSDTATITFTYEHVVWFVDNTNASGSEDGTQADPFNTLADAETAADPGHTFFVFFGDGDTTNQDMGLVFQDGQRLLGEPTGLAVDVDGMGPGMPIQLQAPGSRPRITNTMGDVVLLALDNTVSGVQLEPQASAGITTEESETPMASGVVSKQHYLLDDRSERVSIYEVWRDLYKEEEQDKAQDTHAVKGGFGASLTVIDDVIVEVQNDFSDGLLFLSHMGTVVINDVVINGPTVGLTGYGGLVFFDSTVDATISNLAVNEMFESVVVALNDPTSLFSFDTLNVDTRDGFGLLAFGGGTIDVVGATNTLDTTNDLALVIDSLTVGAPGVTFASVVSDAMGFGLVGLAFDTLTGGPLTITGPTTIASTDEDGLLVDDVTNVVRFEGPVSVAGTSDDGIDLTDVSNVTFASTVMVDLAGDDGIDIQGGDGGILFADMVTLTNSTDVGIELNGNNAGLATGTTTFAGLIDIDNAEVGIFVFDILNQLSFQSIDIDTVTVGGIIFDGAEIQGSTTIASLDVNGGAMSAVGLGMVESSGTIMVNGGTLENIGGEVLGLIDSSVMLTYSGTLNQTTPVVPLLLIDGDDVSTATFTASSSMMDTAGSGLQFEDADGTYTFNGPITITGNDDDGIDVSTSSTGSFSFTAAVAINSGTGDAVDNRGNAPGSIAFSGGLDIDTSSGDGFVSTGLGTISATGTNTVDTDTGNAVELISTTIGASHVTFSNVSSNGGFVTQANTGNTGKLLIDGGTLNGGLTPLRFGDIGDTRFEVRNIVVTGHTGIGARVTSLDNGSTHGLFEGVTINGLGSGFSMQGTSALPGSFGFDLNVSVINSTVNTMGDAVFIAADTTTDPSASVAATLTGNSLTSTASDSVLVTADDAASICLDASSNNPMTSAVGDFSLFQVGPSVLSITQPSLAALGAANDGGAATTFSGGTISFNASCPAQDL